MMSPRQVFISSSGRDRGWIREFVYELSKKGIKASFTDTDTSMDESTVDKLEDELRSSDAFIFILDADNINSSELFFELGAALGMGKQLVAVLDKDVPVADLPGPIKLRRYFPKEDPQRTANEVYPLVAKG